MSFIEQQLATTTIVAFLGDAKPPAAAMKKLIKSGGRGGGGRNHFCKKKSFIYIYISFCTPMPVLANFQIWKHFDAPFWRYKYFYPCTSPKPFIWISLIT